jgi:hypothetical protein
VGPGFDVLGSLDGGWLKSMFWYCGKEFNRNSKTVVIADGGGNLDKEDPANETWDAGSVLFSKTGHGEKVKAGNAMPNRGGERFYPAESPHAPQARLQAMFISRTACAKLIPAQ